MRERLAKRLSVTMSESLCAKAQFRLKELSFGGLSDYLQNLVREDVQGARMLKSEAYQLAVECFIAGRKAAGLPSGAEALEDKLVLRVVDHLAAKGKSI